MVASDFFEIKKPGPSYLFGISATRLSRRDPVGFPSHSREWFSIFVCPIVMMDFLSQKNSNNGVTVITSCVDFDEFAQVK